MGAGDVPALPLRPIDAAGLESLPAAVIAGCRCACPGFLVAFDMAPVMGQGLR